MIVKCYKINYMVFDGSENFVKSKKSVTFASAFAKGIPL